MKKSLLILSLLPLLMACGQTTQSSSADTSGAASTTSEKGWVIHIRDMIGRSVEIKPGTYKRVVCVGAG
nr:hypothetical protein [Bacilli bacterium]